MESNRQLGSAYEYEKYLYTSVTLSHILASKFRQQNQNINMQKSKTTYR